MEGALDLIARTLYERTYFSPWRAADCWARARAFQTARAVLEDLDARRMLHPDVAADLDALNALTPPGADAGGRA